MSIAYIDEGTLEAKQEALRSELLKLGYDGIIYKNTGEPDTNFEKGDPRRYQDSYIVFNANQIKSATGNTGAFSSTNNDIRFSKVLRQSENNPTSANDLERVIDSGEMPKRDFTTSDLNDKIVTYLVDSTRPFDVAMRELPDQLQAAKIVQAKDLAPGRKQAFEKEAMDRFGKDIAEGIKAIAVATGKNFNWSKEMAGQWMTLKYAQIANHRLLKQYEAAADEAAQAVQDFIPDPQKTDRENNAELLGLKTASSKADKLLVAFDEAMNKQQFVDPVNEKHDIGLAGGYNNYTAKALMAKIESKVDVNLIKTVAERVYSMNKWKLEQDIANGKVTQEMADKFDDSGFYVPLTGDTKDMLRDDSDDGLFYVGNVNQSKDKRLQGRTQSIAQNGIDSSFEQIEKSARYHAWVKFKDYLGETYQQMIDDKVAAGLSEKDAMTEIADETGWQRKPERQGIRPSDSGIIVRKNGTTFVYELNNKAAIDALRKANVETVPSMLDVFAPVTRFYSRMATQIMPTFGPVNAIRDVFERTENIRTRKIKGYENIDMNKVGSDALKYAMNIGAIAKIAPMITKGVTATVDDTNPDVKLFKDFINEGAFATWGDYLSPDKGELLKKLEGITKLSTKAMKAVEGYNNVFEVIAPFSVYKSLVNNGVDSESAAATTLNLMNFHKKGAGLSMVRGLYMFAQPTANGAHQLIQTLSTPRGQYRYGAYLVAGMVLYSMLRSGEDDDELGVNRMDKESNFAVDRNIMIPLGEKGRYLKVPVGFGIQQLAWSNAVNIVRAAKGSQTIEDTVGEIIKSWVKTMTPVAPSEAPIAQHPLTFIVQTMTPQIGKGAINVAMDVNTFGNQLTKQFKDESIARSIQGKRTRRNSTKTWRGNWDESGLMLILSRFKNS
jgi:hypothetical protein